MTALERASRKLARAAVKLSDVKLRLKEAKRRFNELYDIVCMRGWVNRKAEEAGIAIDESASLR